MIPKPKKPKTSLRYELICGGAVEKYPDGREVCTKTVKGRNEYRRRIDDMVNRQNGICGLNEHYIQFPTFEHSAGRGMGAGHRDDRIVDENGNPMNCAACWTCNTEKGSKRA